jgi:uncharacterized membrane protein affecting hemolysin expression
MPRRQFDLKMKSRAFQRAIMVLTVISFALSACQSMYEFTVVQQDANSAILSRISNLLVAQGFKPISQFSPDPRTIGCHVVAQDGAFSKETQSRGTIRTFSVNYLVCDGYLRVDVSSSHTDSWSDQYEKKLVNLLRQDLESEIAAGQVIVKTNQYVALGP